MGFTKTRAFRKISYSFLTDGANERIVNWDILLAFFTKRVRKMDFFFTRNTLPREKSI